MDKKASSATRQQDNTEVRTSAKETIMVVRHVHRIDSLVYIPHMLLAVALILVDAA